MHNNCGWQFHERYVSKTVPYDETKSDHQKWGIYVHKQFQWYGDRPGFELPPDLIIHKPYLAMLNDEGEKASVDLTERKVALSNKPFGPCEYFDKTKPVWWRGDIDRQQVWLGESRARIVDFKTGKKKIDFAQLGEYALWTFFEYPTVNLINAQFYWVEDQTVTKRVWARSEMDSIISLFSAKLEAYMESFRTEIFTKKQSGLCKGHCPVTSCMFWEPKKERY